MQASISRRLVTKMWIGHMLIVQMLTSSTLQIEQHSFTRAPSCCCLWLSFVSVWRGRTEERAEYLCQDVDTVLFGSIALSQMRGQLRLPLCDAAKYRNSRKGLCVQASINRRLVTKMWIGHALIAQMLTRSTLHIWPHSFTKVPSCCCLWFSLFSCRWGLTEEGAEYLCQDVDIFSIQLHLAKCGGNCACHLATLPNTTIVQKVCACRQVSIGA